MSGRPPVAGLLLTGGASRRMGVDKASMVVGGCPLAERLAGLLADLVAPAVEVGPGISSLPAVREQPPGGGPLAAVAAGVRHLAARGPLRPAVVLSCDLPRLDAESLAVLVSWPGNGAVVPLREGRPQPLCARWAADDLLGAARAESAGRRSLQGLPELRGATVVAEEAWSEALGPHAYRDADTPDDLVALGLAGAAPARYQPGPSG